MIGETAVERRLHGSVHLWTIPVGHGSGDLMEASAVLDAEEIDRARRFSSAELRTRYLDAHVAVRRILARYLGVLPEEIRFTRTGTQKPLVVGADLAFNVSHSGGLAVCAVAERGDISERERFARIQGTRRIARALGRIGVDIEAIRPVEDADGIVKRFFAPAEAAEYERCKGESRRAAFFQLWTHKESFVKATGEGLYRPLDSFAVVAALGGDSTRLRTSGAADRSARWCLHAFTPAPGYAGALALDQQVASINLLQWREGREPVVIGAAGSTSVSRVSLTL